MNQSEFLSVACNLLKAREKMRVQGAIGFAFASLWLHNWQSLSVAVANGVIAFVIHLKTALVETVVLVIIIIIIIKIIIIIIIIIIIVIAIRGSFNISRLIFSPGYRGHR